MINVPIRVFGTIEVLLSWLFLVKIISASMWSVPVVPILLEVAVQELAAVPNIGGWGTWFGSRNLKCVIVFSCPWSGVKMAVHFHESGDSIKKPFGFAGMFFDFRCQRADPCRLSFCQPLFLSQGITERMPKGSKYALMGGGSLSKRKICICNYS